MVAALTFGVFGCARPGRSVTTGRCGTFIMPCAVVTTTSNAGTLPMGSVYWQESFRTGDCPGRPEVVATTVLASGAVSRCCMSGFGVTSPPVRSALVADAAAAD